MKNPLFHPCVLLVAATEMSMAQPPVRAVLPPEIELRANLAYAGTENPRQQLDVLIPRQRRAAKLPVVMAIHGGAFRMGDRSQTHGELLNLVQSGNYVGVAIGYRLSSEAIWPAQIEDCKAAVRWLRAHADELGLDAQRIGVMGGSAGGHLAAMLGTSGGVAELEGKLGAHSDQSSHVQCVVDQFGPVDLLTLGQGASAQDHFSADSPESQLLGGPVLQRKELARQASPATYVSNDDPPFLIIHGDKDPLIPFQQSVDFAQLLKKSAVSVRFIPITNGGHGGFGNEEVEQRIQQFFDLHLRQQGHEVSETAIMSKGKARPAPVKK